MNGKKIVITARNSDLPDAGAVRLLEESGFTVIDHSGKNCGTSTSEEEMSALIGDADGVITGLEPVGRKVLESCPNLILIFIQPIDKFDSYNAATRRQVAL